MSELLSPRFIVPPSKVTLPTKVERPVTFKLSSIIVCPVKESRIKSELNVSISLDCPIPILISLDFKPCKKVAIPDASTLEKDAAAPATEIPFVPE